MIKKNRIINSFLYIQLFLSLTGELLCSLNERFSVLYFMIDFICISSAVMVIFIDRKQMVMRGVQQIGIFFAILFCLYAAVSFLWSSHDIVSAVKRFRFMVTGLITLYIASNYLSNAMYSKMVDLMSWMMYVNLPICAIQYFVSKLHPDFCNGIFGFTEYANGIQGMFCLLISILACVYYIDEVWNAARSASLLLCACVVCALAEIKLYFVMFAQAFVLILFARVLWGKPRKAGRRVLHVVAAVTFGVALSYWILSYVMPSNLRVFQSVSGAIAYEERTEYAGRINTIPFILQNHFNGDIVLSLLGSGLGSASQSFIYELGKTFSDQGFLGVGLLMMSLLSTGIKDFWDRNMATSKLCHLAFGVMAAISVIVWNATFTRAATSIVFLALGFRNVSYLNKEERSANNV